MLCKLIRVSEAERGRVEISTLCSVTFFVLVSDIACVCCICFDMINFLAMILLGDLNGFFSLVSLSLAGVLDWKVFMLSSESLGDGLMGSDGLRFDIEVDGICKR